MLYLRDDLRPALGADAESAFERLQALPAEVFRIAGGRRTVRFDWAGRSYFAKLHYGVGWGEICKCLLALKRPVLGARNEFDACRRLAARGVAAPVVAAFGTRGRNPARQRSFVACDALAGFASLEDIAATPGALADAALRRRLIAAAADLARRMHDAGVGHRDFYLCHLLADRARLAGGEAALAVIDLHRARVAARTTAAQRIRDLGALLFSVSALGLTRADRMRFVAAYCAARPAAELRRRARFWRRVQARAQRLRRRTRGTGAVAGAAPGDAAIASIENLAALPRDPPLPFRFDLRAGGATLRVVCRELLRIAPGRRLVARGSVGGESPVIVKAFCGRRGRRRMRRELRGTAALAAAGAQVPRLLHAGSGGAGAVLAIESIGGAQPASAGDLPRLMETLALLHRAGVRQRDLHAGNFLVRAGTGTVFALDGSDVRRQRVGARTALRDAATLLAQFPVDAVRIAAATRAYAGAGGGREKGKRVELECGRLRRECAAMRRRRARILAGKSVRDCTPFAVSRAKNVLVAVARGERSETLAAILADPEAALATGTMLKSGNSATVARVGELVVKRYRHKTGWQRARRRLRSSRARRAWRIGHGLQLLGIPTPTPRALIEHPGAATGSAAAYLVTDYVEGAPLTEATRREPPPELLDALRRLLRDLRAARLGHGDMKASNLLLANGRVHLVDLDAAALCAGGAAFARRHRKDLARFLRNWPAAARPALAAALEGEEA